MLRNQAMMHGPRMNLYTELATFQFGTHTIIVDTLHWAPLNESVFNRLFEGGVTTMTISWIRRSPGDVFVNSVAIFVKIK